MPHQSDQNKMNLSMLNEQAVAGASSSLKEQDLTTKNKPSCLVYSGQSVVKCKLFNANLKFNIYIFFIFHNYISINFYHSL